MIEFIIQLVCRIIGVRLVHRATEEALDSLDRAEERSGRSPTASRRVILARHEQAIAAAMSAQPIGAGEPPSPQGRIGGPTAANGDGHGASRPFVPQLPEPRSPAQQSPGIPVKRRGRPRKQPAAEGLPSSPRGGGAAPVIGDDHHQSSKGDPA